MKKFTIEDVQAYLNEHDTNHGCTLLSNEYINSKEKLKFKCNVCGKTFERTFADVRRNEKYSCRVCSQGRTLGIENVQKYLQEHDVAHECELISTQYVNNRTPLRFKCLLCGNEFERTMTQVRENQRYCCFSCMKKSQGGRNKLTLDVIKERISKLDLEQDCELLSTEYVNACTPLTFKCNCCGNTFLRKWETMQQKRAFKCFACAHGYDADGTSDIYRQNINYFRHKVRPWRDQYLAQHPMCDITGRTDDLEVHHLINFQTILNMASEETGIPLIYSPKDYVSHGYDIETLAKKVIELHESVPAVVLTRDVHQQFHKTFGYKNNTPEQYQTFKESYVP